MPQSRFSLRMRATLLAASFTLLASCAGSTSGATASRAPRVAPDAATLALLPGPKPWAPPEKLKSVVGEYDCRTSVCLVIEDGGRLWLLDTAKASPKRVPYEDAGMALKRREVGPQAGTTQLQVKPVRPIPAVRTEALAASPPAEAAPARAAELVELVSVDPTIKLDIRYATTNNFLGARFYDEARAFMQRPAADALVRANKKLRTLGYGLLIHDAYRPWYVTKMFWDATPLDKRWLVANPASGSKHNRGAAVDLTLFELSTGKPVEMPGTYDETTGRSFADYPGGTSLQRWHRGLLRNAMVAEGFLVNPSEWWHFDYKSWRDYAIGNVAFDRIGK